jgi:hypothetical protein
MSWSEREAGGTVLLQLNFIDSLWHYLPTYLQHPFLGCIDILEVLNYVYVCALFEGLLARAVANLARSRS